ncbi:CHAP domain-containing protein [Kutzneria buriramensis]|uniref:PLL-like beta propeller domain-containing protein n=1 Tax=Kutzneria buriramensis TaxID=1045776 RepID=A0A3E0GXN2_9PSEU|nr:CHAP domain-containing protein [Kutzneria buriramensis]REH29650.1 hypothetical protein BCF44_12477 [Kutzneria buriramensis]
MPSAHNRRLLAGLTAAALSGVALVGVGAHAASAATGSQIVNIADANLGKGYCSTNSAGGRGFDNSCTADNGAGEFWCGDFVSWVWQQAGVPVPAASPASVPSWKNTSAYHALGSGYVPQPGDAVIFGDNTYPTSGSHIAIVTDYSNGLLSDVGGDEDGGGNPWWSTSKVQADEGNGAAWNPNNHLFPGQSYEMWVLGYVSSGASTTPPPPPPTSGAATSDSSWSVYAPATKTMTLFGLGAGGHLGLTRSTNGGASWSNWAEANAYWQLQGTPDAVYDADAKMTMLFARGQSDGAMGISTSTNNGASWSNWAQVNAYWSGFKGDASAVYNPDTKKVTVFARGGDGRIGYTQSGNAGASWSNWAQVNAYWANFSGDPHAIYDPDTKKLTVFARGGDGRIGYTQSANDGASWSNWAEVNAYWANFAGDPHVVYDPDAKKLTVFARGGDGKIGYTQSGNGGASWSSWAEVNAYWANFSGDPRPVYDASTKTISLLARGADGRIGATRSANDGASWSNWAQANAYWANFSGDPAAIYDPDTKQSTVFALGSGGHMGYTQSVASGWTNWAEVNAYWTLIGS